MEFFNESLPKNTAGLVKILQDNNPRFLRSFYLSGGTGLALQLGHRESDDLDFFSQEAFNPEKIEQELTSLGQLSETQRDENTLNTYLNGVKLQFLKYPYPLLEATHDWHGIQISSTIDIACTKLQTAGARGGKKDFIDIYFLLEKYSLTEILAKANEKYKSVDYSTTHILKSLVFFEDAEAQPMPRMLKDIEWSEVKTRIVEEVKRVTF